MAVRTCERGARLDMFLRVCGACGGRSVARGRYRVVVVSMVRGGVVCRKVEKE